MHLLSSRPHSAIKISSRRRAGTVRGGILQNCGLALFLRNFDQVVNTINVTSVQGINARGNARQRGANIWATDGGQPTQLS